MLSAQPRTEDIPRIVENQPQRQRAENHQDQGQPHRFTQECRAEAHDPQSYDHNDNRHTDSEQAEPTPDNKVSDSCPQFTAPVVNGQLHITDQCAMCRNGLIRFPVKEI